MTELKEPDFTNACEAAQWEISQALDEGRSVPESVGAHIASCADCAHFVRLWRDGTGAASTLKEIPILDPALCQRVLGQSLRTNVTPQRTATLSAYLIRFAAVVAFAALAWWLLDPHEGRPLVKRAPRPEPGRLAPASASIDRQMARLKQVGDDERRALRTAMVDGGTRFRDILAWSSEVLE